MSLCGNQSWTNAMPIGPKGERRPADVIGNAVRVMRIATRRAAMLDVPYSN
jgi:hypothetical protein